MSESKIIVAFTDGSCYNNGKDDKDQRAGIGVYYPGYQSHNLSETLPLDFKTNNRAELYAIIRCLEHIFENPQGLPLEKNTIILIKSDSLVCIKSITEWIGLWRKNGWKKSGSNESIENKDLWLRLDALLEVFPYTVKFEHVKGHGKEPKEKDTEEWWNWFGNMISDRLANDAVRAHI